MLTLDIDSGSGRRRIDLFSYLDPDQEERAHQDAYAWIKAVRHLRVDGVPFRSRFTFRGDSLWWFAELYLHKQQAILNVHRVLSAFDALVERERPLAVTHVSGELSAVVAHAAAVRKIRYAGPGWGSETAKLVRMDARASALALAAFASRLRSSRLEPKRAVVAAFVHRAFWRSGSSDGGAESYIGPVLRALESRLPPAAVRYVGVGPQHNFRARRWWHALSPQRDQRIDPIERYAAASALAASRAVFRERHASRAALWASVDLRAHATIRGCDCWPLVKEQLAGIALLQFPWSARAMDEAAAALAAIEPKVAVTYAEAGGWGRALALECRRSGVPLGALQHGFIYRHWLNYRHEDDETRADPVNPSDAGFPFPARTLLFDDQAARQLRCGGRFTADTLVVSGSARLDELRTAVSSLDRAAIDRTRADVGAADRPLVLFAAKEREARRALPALLAAVRAMPEVQLVVKPHPAETPGVYAAAVSGVPNIHVVPANAPLPPLIAAAAAVVTVNSTVAIDALSFGVPAIVIGLPNNLTPFVDAKLMQGADSVDEIRAALAQVRYDREFHGTARQAGTDDGQSAEKSAAAILALTGAD